ncbi:MAG TPA: trypsin-like peptidase domain-containing protein [Acidimicrobiia bacterium]|nr:trypsin-like peptidase domain-containing protein [Acidimicrobiia bacterium]
MPVEEPEDEHDAGLPPHPLDRVWFHPSELGSAMAVWRETPATKRRDWGLAALVGALSVAATVGLLAAVGLFGSQGHSTNRASVASVLPGTPTPHDSTANVVAAASPSVVSVRVSTAMGPVQGSGVAVDGSRVLTSAALVGTGATVMVAVADGKAVKTATVVGTDAQTDLSLLKVDDSDLRAARLGHSDSLRVGDGVVALGLGLTDHHWAGGGIVSALNRIDPTPSGGILSSVIETDVKLTAAPWAAGGALLDNRGSVVGILSASLPGHAIPIDLAQTVMEQIESSGRVHHAWLGVGTIDATDRGGGGARVTVVVPGSPAAKTGLAVGDVITGVSGSRVADTGDLVAAVQQLRPGDPIMVTAWRGTQRGVHTFALEDGTGPAGTAYGVMG